MRKAITKSVRTRRQALKPEDRLLNSTWAGIARREETVLNAATEVVETLPAPVDVIDGALTFAAKTLKAQREALVPLLESVTPGMARGRTVPRRHPSARLSAARCAQPQRGRPRECAAKSPPLQEGFASLMWGSRS